MYMEGWGLYAQQIIIALINWRIESIPKLGGT